jgi:putative transposase
LGGLPFAGFAKGGFRVFIMPQHLKRRTGRNDLHFITFCCYHRKRLLDSVHCRNLAVRILDEVRGKYGFFLVGYVIMPGHVHLLVSETGAVPPAKIVQIFKQRVSREMRGETPELQGELERFWQRRYYDFNVYSQKKLREKLAYMHANPVEEHLVQHPREWPWSSWSNYELGDGMLKIDAR